MFVYMYRYIYVYIYQEKEYTVARDNTASEVLREACLLVIVNDNCMFFRQTRREHGTILDQTASCTCMRQSQKHPVCICVYCDNRNALRDPKCVCHRLPSNFEVRCGGEGKPSWAIWIGRPCPDYLWSARQTRISIPTVDHWHIWTYF